MSGNKDVEKHAGQNSQQKPFGFAALASLMASDGDQELLIFRKFDEISARNLLYLQCELLLIEERLKKWDKKLSRSGDMDLDEAAATWEVMLEQAKDGRTEAKEMMELVGQLRAKMKEYHEALDLQSRIVRLDRPDRRVLRVAQNELWGGPLDPDGLKGYPIVGGKTKDYLDNENDLVSLKTPVETDPLSKMLRGFWPGKRDDSRDGHSRIVRFDERSILIAVALVNTIVAIILLVGPVTGLSFMHSRAAILGMICAFTVAFALSVGLMTNAKRAEIFAGSAAYAAVLVVFVSNGDLSGSNSGK
ncbi:uncharacterized protein FTOL_03291 [Fusarium torulosum]|uniref:DUF6594 domain-containing protein n=1 Tax=Fusarium torulosum TaxID=33205 RepID=A0AAE8SFF0_9HYPO|nr:uncharacterized protein FTOL_03291 [Fusarium torulosum]